MLIVWGGLLGQHTDTNYELPSMIMGIPCARWGAQPFIVHPIPYPDPLMCQCPLWKVIITTSYLCVTILCNYS